MTCHMGRNLLILNLLGWNCLCRYRKLTIGGSVAGWASLVSIILFIGGIQLLALGIIGNYISKIF
ncbi:MAG: hypothetical protein ACLTZB_02455 [Streptococcus salivarius]